MHHHSAFAAFVLPYGSICKETISYHLPARTSQVQLPHRFLRTNFPIISQNHHTTTASIPISQRLVVVPVVRAAQAVQAQVGVPCYQKSLVLLLCLPSRFPVDPGKLFSTAFYRHLCIDRGAHHVKESAFFKPAAWLTLTLWAFQAPA